MRKNLYWLFLTTVFILSMAMASVGTASPQEPVIRLELHDTAAGVGETFTVDITVTGITEEESLYGWECSITFNPGIINVVNVTEGPFLTDTGYSTYFAKRIDNTTGTVKTLSTITEFPYPPTGANGSGTLATIIFKAVGQGATGLVFEEKDDTTLQTILGEPPYQNNYPIAHTAEGGFFNNGGPPILLYIVGIIAVVAASAVAVFYFWRKRASTRT